MPGRLLYWKVKALENRAAATTSRVAWKSSSVSPGKPTMMSVVIAACGIAARTRSMMPDQVAKDVVSQRYQRLIELQETISMEENAAQIGRTVELLVATGEGRKDVATARMSGRARDGRLVHFAPGPDAAAIRPGDVVVTTVTGAAPHHLIADATLIAHRRTRAGDAHENGQRPSTGTGLGMPGIGAPAQSAPVAAGCAR